MKRFVDWLDKRFYPGVQRNWDDFLLRQRILDRIKANDRVLDLGAGAGIVEHMNFKGLVSDVCGVDLDPRVVDNPMLDEGRIADAGRIPYENSCFDLVFADNVMEHISDPAAVLAEISRVLKPGGRFLFKTPNRTHYMPLIARLTPHRFHQFVNRLRGRAEADTFPTEYRFNTRRHVFGLASSAGFEVIWIDRIEGRPEYLRMAWPTYLIGILYERFVNLTPFLAPFRILLVAELRKPGGNP